MPGRHPAASTALLASGNARGNASTTSRQVLAVMHDAATGVRLDLTLWLNAPTPGQPERTLSPPAHKLGNQKGAHLLAG